MHFSKAKKADGEKGWKGRERAKLRKAHQDT